MKLIYLYGRFFVDYFISSCTSFIVYTPFQSIILRAGYSKPKRSSSKVSCYVTCCMPLSPAPPSTHLWYAEQSQQIGHLYRRHRWGSAHHPRNDLSHLRLVAMVLGVVNVADGACNKEKKGEEQKGNQCQVPSNINILLYTFCFFNLRLSAVNCDLFHRLQTDSLLHAVKLQLLSVHLQYLFIFISHFPFMQWLLNTLFRFVRLYFIYFSHCFIILQWLELMKCSVKNVLFQLIIWQL